MAKSQEKGEGSYQGTRDYNARTKKFLDGNKGKVGKLAKEAAKAVEGKDRAKLEAAEAEGKSHARH